MSTPHKHAAVIKAWADGLAIQRCSFMTNHEWWDLEDGDEPCFMGSANWRVKPEPHAKVYPVTGMSDIEVAKAWQGPCGFEIAYLYGFANAALRHAIKSNEVITMADHEAELVKLSLGLRDFQVERHAARDMAIAEAVRFAYAFPGREGIDIAAIITAVKD